MYANFAYIAYNCVQLRSIAFMNAICTQFPFFGLWTQNVRKWTQCTQIAYICVHSKIIAFIVWTQFAFIWTQFAYIWTQFAYIWTQCTQVNANFLLNFICVHDMKNNNFQNNLRSRKQPFLKIIIKIKIYLHKRLQIAYISWTQFAFIKNCVHSILIKNCVHRIAFTILAFLIKMWFYIFNCVHNFF